MVTITGETGVTNGSDRVGDSFCPLLLCVMHCFNISIFRTNPRTKESGALMLPLPTESYG